MTMLSADKQFIVVVGIVLAPVAHILLWLINLPIILHIFIILFPILVYFINETKRSGFVQLIPIKWLFDWQSKQYYIASISVFLLSLHIFIVDSIIWIEFLIGICLVVVFVVVLRKFAFVKKEQKDEFTVESSTKTSTTNTTTSFTDENRVKALETSEYEKEKDSFCEKVISNSRSIIMEKVLAQYLLKAIQTSREHRSIHLLELTRNVLHTTSTMKLRDRCDEFASSLCDSGDGDTLERVCSISDVDVSMIVSAIGEEFDDNTKETEARQYGSGVSIDTSNIAKSLMEVDEGHGGNTNPADTTTTTKANITTTTSVNIAQTDTNAVWRTYYDEKTKRSYYHNRNTGETTWKMPLELKANTGASTNTKSSTPTTSTKTATNTKTPTSATNTKTPTSAANTECPTCHSTTIEQKGQTTLTGLTRYRCLSCNYMFRISTSTSDRNLAGKKLITQNTESVLVGVSGKSMTKPTLNRTGTEVMMTNTHTTKPTIPPKPNKKPLATPTKPTPVAPKEIKCKQCDSKNIESKDVSVRTGVGRFRCLDCNLVFRSVLPAS